MQTAFEIARALSAVAFLFYGIACLCTPRMKVEFERYGLARYRSLVGALECLGALGLLVGHFNRPVLIMAAAGLTLTMLLGIATRIRIGDSLVRTLPAIVLLVLNAFLLGVAVTQS
jgi:DoxX-like family